MTTTQWLMLAGFVLMYAGQAISHFSHKKAIQQIGQDVQTVGQKVEQNAPAIATAVKAVIPSFSVVTETAQPKA